MLRYSLDAGNAATAVENAVGRVLDWGCRTADIAAPGDAVLGTEAMGSAVLSAIDELQDATQ